jgi:hypothetical protein
VYIPRMVDFLRGSGVAVTASLVLSEWTLARVVSGHSPFTALMWLAALALMIRATPGAAPPQRAAARSARAWRLFVVLLPCLVRLASLRSDRIHGDDLITAYFSTRYELGRTDLFAPVPPNVDDWVCQFPAPFFALQKLFFVLFGESLLTVKLSILPYVIVASGFLYAIARELVDERAAVLSVILYAFFGASVYLETLGLHFVSSTAVFLAFFYFSLRELRQGAPRQALLAGMTAGACYLFYLSSFLALPVAGLFFVARGTPQRERHVGRNLALFLLGGMMVLAPFILRALQTPNALFRRFEQVSLIGGQWSFSYTKQVANGATPVQIVCENVWRSLESIVLSGIGGSGGYGFAKQALLEPLSFALFVLGALRAIALASTSIEWVLLLVTTALFFLVNVGLSTPPPAFHRFSIGFPFLCLLLALPLHALLAAPWGGVAWRRTVVAATLAAFVCTQTCYARRAMIPESDFDELRLARFVDEQFPDRPLYVAAFPTYAFERFYHFARVNRDRRVTTDYHATLLDSFDRRRKYVYVITLPAAFDAQFARRDPQGRFIHFSPQFSLFVN